MVQQLGHATVWQEGACLTVKVASQSVKGLEDVLPFCVTIGHFDVGEDGVDLNIDVASFARSF